MPLIHLDSIAHKLARTIGNCANLGRIVLFSPRSTQEDPAFQLFDGKLKLKLSIQTEALLTIFKEVHDNVTRQVGIAKRKVRLLLNSHLKGID